mmetsp:Transcript_86381/g.243926  ORF Transcript_86381/g.243926 Transcript_86381/m.243926 type:complete len:247 (-) Transcript_86381:455-1195(-)
MAIVAIVAIVGRARRQHVAVQVHRVLVPGYRQDLRAGRPPVRDQRPPRVQFGAVGDAVGLAEALRQLNRDVTDSRGERRWSQREPVGGKIRSVGPGRPAVAVAVGLAFLCVCTGAVHVAVGLIILLAVVYEKVKVDLIPLATAHGRKRGPATADVRYVRHSVHRQPCCGGTLDRKSVGTTFGPAFETAVSAGEVGRRLHYHRRATRDAGQGIEAADVLRFCAGVTGWWRQAQLTRSMFDDPPHLGQ